MRLRWKLQAIKRIIKTDNHLLITFDKNGDLVYNCTFTNDELAQIGRWLNGYHGEMNDLVRQAKEIINQKS